MAALTARHRASCLSGNPPNFARPTSKDDGSTAAPIFGYGTQNSYPLGFPYPAFDGRTLVF